MPDDFTFLMNISLNKRNQENSADSCLLLRSMSRVPDVMISQVAFSEFSLPGLLTKGPQRYKLWDDSLPAGNPLEQEGSKSWRP